MLAILGSGDSKEEQAIRDLSISFPDRIGSLIGFDDGLARRILPDPTFIMPSRFEPCGLAQQYAMIRPLPIARKTGGLADTIIPVSRGACQWFLFDNATAKELWITVKHALEVYANNRKFTQMRKNAMNRDCGWARAAEQYIDVYKWAKECSNPILNSFSGHKLIHT